MEIYIPEKPLLQAASSLTFELNCAFATLRSIALERDIKNFVMVHVSFSQLLFRQVSLKFIYRSCYFLF